MYSSVSSHCFPAQGRKSPSPPSHTLQLIKGLSDSEELVVQGVGRASSMGGLVIIIIIIIGIIVIIVIT